MSRENWIWIRILGWALIILWFLVYEVNLLVPLLSHQWVNVMSGLIGAIGTFLVLFGYYKLASAHKKMGEG